MESVRIKITLRGTWCHDWPDFVVTVNNHTYFAGKVKEEITIDIHCESLSQNQLCLIHHGKRFGEGGIWDTVSHQNTIVQDRAVRLVGIEINEVEISKYVWNNCALITDCNNKVLTDYYGFNGTVTVNFASPVYDWIIDNIVRYESRKLLDISQPLETSYDNLFDYAQDEIELQGLETLLNQYAHLFNKHPTL